MVLSSVRIVHVGVCLTFMCITTRYCICDKPYKIPKKISNNKLRKNKNKKKYIYIYIYNVLNIGRGSTLFNRLVNVCLFVCFLFIYFLFIVCLFACFLGLVFSCFVIFFSLCKACFSATMLICYFVLRHQKLVASTVIW